MKVEEFIIFALQNNRQFKHNLNDNQYRKGFRDWETHMKLARLTRLLDYGCDFNERGCSNWRITKKQLKEMQEKGKRLRELACCCSSCYKEIGYLKVIPNNLNIIKKIARYFKKEVGFWRPDKGCILPRQYRSTTCLIYRCRSISPHHSGSTLLYYLELTNEEMRKHYRGKTGSNTTSINVIIRGIHEAILKEKEEMANAKNN